MKHRQHIVTVFGSSRSQPGELEFQTAYELGKLLALTGFEICNGGYNGTMEASARGAKDAGGKTIGVVTEYFKRSANPYIEQIIAVKTLNDRLLKLIELGDAYVALKGSTGTLVELATVWEYLNKNVIEEKPIIVIGNFWMPVINTLKEELIHEGLEDVSKFISFAATPKECVEILKKRLK